MLRPVLKASIRATRPWVEAQAIDFGKGLDDIEFHVDLDRDGTFGEAGEVLAPSEGSSQAVPAGHLARALLPEVSGDGSISWYVTAADNLGNSDRSDADLATAGDQNHSFIIDLSPPHLVSAATGQSFSATTKKITSGQTKSVRADFSETLDAAQVLAERFIVDGSPASAAVVYGDHPKTVCLTVPSLLGRSNVLISEAGAVQDVPATDHIPAS